MKIKHFLFGIITLITFSCTKEPQPSPCRFPDCSDTLKTKPNVLELVWQKTLRADNEYTPNNKISFVGSFVCIQYDYIEREKVLYINKTDTTSSRWANINPDNFVDKFTHPTEGIILIDHFNMYKGINSNSMKLFARSPENLQFFSKNKLIGDYIYSSFRDESLKVNYIYKYNVFSGEQILDEKIPDSDCPECKYIIVYSPNLITTANSDSILVYNNIYSQGHGVGTIKVKAYILKNNKRSLLWESDNPRSLFGGLGNTVYNNVAINLNNPVYAVDIYTGKIVWEKPNNVKGSDWLTIVRPLIIEGKLYTISSGRFYVINPNDGTVEYESDEIYGSYTESNLCYFDGVIYWTAGYKGESKIFGMRLSDRKLVLSMNSPNFGKEPYLYDTNYYYNGLVIDPSTRLAYTADGFFAQCFRIPDKYN